MQTSETLTGQVERITFHNPDNGYTIARLKQKDDDSLVTIAGSLPSLSSGEMLRLTGTWFVHPKYGRQFKIDSHETLRPTSLSGIEKYLGSGVIKGIGPVMARLMVQKFGTETLDIIEQTPERITEVPGIGPKRAKVVLDAWGAQKDIRHVMLFLQEHDVTPSFAVKIFKQYGKDSIRLVTENPYRMAEEITGIGFRTADQIATRLGVDRNSPFRARAGILHLLREASEEGHLFFPYMELIDRCITILTLDRDTVIKGFSDLFEGRQIVIEDLNDPDQEFLPNNKAVYLSPFYNSEMGIAAELSRLLRQRPKNRPAATGDPLQWVQDTQRMTLSDKQEDAVKAALEQKVLVVTGGPGTGKTTLIKSICQIFGKMGLKIALGAPTGRAAKRMAESTGRPAATLHRLLEWDYKSGGFKRDARHPLETDLVILDECSMIESLLMYYLLRAVPDQAVLVLVGDTHQLPSVGPGNVFKDIISSGVIRTITLDKIFRQAMESAIVRNAHRVNQGEAPELEGDTSLSRDFFFIEKEEPEAVRDALLEMAVNRIPARFGFHPLRDIQILTPMHKGVIGSEQLNSALQEAVNPNRRTLTRGLKVFREQDKVMQIRNNYDKEVFNGDIGYIETINSEEEKLHIRFDDRIIEYGFEELDEIMLAYAVSVHKSQGSEYAAIVMPIHTTHYLLLQRNLLYTGLTRARKLAVLIGSKRALSIAIKNDKPARRFTGLQEKIKSFLVNFRTV